MIAATVDDGWCVFWASRGCSLFCECVWTPEGSLMCVPCAAKESGLGKDATGGEVVKCLNSHEGTR